MDWIRDHPEAVGLLKVTISFLTSLVGLVVVVLKLQAARGGRGGGQSSHGGEQGRFCAAWRSGRDLLWLFISLPILTIVFDKVLDLIGGPADGGEPGLLVVLLQTLYMIAGIFQFLGMLLGPLLALGMVYIGTRSAIERRSFLRLVHAWMLVVLGAALWLAPLLALNVSQRSPLNGRPFPPPAEEEYWADGIALAVYWDHEFSPALGRDWNADGQLTDVDSEISARYINIISIDPTRAGAIVKGPPERKLDVLREVCGGDFDFDGSANTPDDRRIEEFYARVLGVNSTPPDAAP